MLHASPSTTWPVNGGASLQQELDSSSVSDIALWRRLQSDASRLTQCDSRL